MIKSLNIREAKKTDAIALAKLSGELGYPTTRRRLADFILPPPTVRETVLSGDSPAPV